MNKLVGFFLVSALFFIMVCPLYAGIETRSVEYKDGDIALEGYIAYDDAIKDKTPAVLIVHEWTGLGDYVKARVRQIAELGYVAFAVDIYGKGIRPKNREEAGREASIYRQDRALMRRRAHAGLEELKKVNIVDEKRIAAIGYCFGGGVVLEMARGGEDLKGVVSFHGSLESPEAKEPKNIKAKILVLHGADDPNIAHNELADFENEMRLSHADWQVTLYGSAVHSFTNPESGDDPSKGAAYNKMADTRSWEAMKIFFREIFGQTFK